MARPAETGPRAAGPGAPQGLVVRVEAVPEDVLLPFFAVDDGQLDARDEPDALPPRGLAEGRQTLDGVVVGQGRGPDPGRGQPFGQLGRSELPVAELGVAVKVDAEEFWHGAFDSPPRGRPTIAPPAKYCQ